MSRSTPSPRTAITRGHCGVRGFSLVELLVAVAIGLVVTLAVFGVLAASEGRKRTSVSVNDANQSGAYAAYTIDRMIRSAGSGFTEGWGRVGGCRLNATLGGAGTWPRAAALPAPFTAIPQTLRLAPVVIFQGASTAGSDVLMVMNGAAGFAESPVAVRPGSMSALEFRAPNTIGFFANDLLLLAGSGECQLTQVDDDKAACAADPAAVFPPLNCGQQVPLGGSFHNASSTTFATLATADAYAIPLGNTTTNRPQFQLLGVGDNTTLFSYDMLLLNGTDAPLPLAEGVMTLRAVYGVDTDDDGVINDWFAPTGTTWGGAALMDGSPASAANLRRIVAVRVGLVMRSSLVERANVAPATLSLFTDLTSGGASLKQDVAIATADQSMRHRTIEVTVPVRNLLLRP